MYPTIKRDLHFCIQSKLRDVYSGFVELTNGERHSAYRLELRKDTQFLFLKSISNVVSVVEKKYDAKCSLCSISDDQFRLFFKYKKEVTVEIVKARTETKKSLYDCGQLRETNLFHRWLAHHHALSAHLVLPKEERTDAESEGEAFNRCLLACAAYDGTEPRTKRIKKLASLLAERSGLGGSAEKKVDPFYATSNDDFDVILRLAEGKEIKHETENVFDIRRIESIETLFPDVVFGFDDSNLELGIKFKNGLDDSVLKQVVAISSARGITFMKNAAD